MSPEFKQKVGADASVKWPVGVGGKGNEGVTGMVRQTPGSIGYIELVYALQNKVPVGAAVEVTFEEVAPGQLIHEWRVVN